MLELRGIRAGYGQRDILDGFSLHVEQGEIVGVVGPNGAGKSTVLKAVMGLVTVRQGKIFVDACEISGHSPENIVRSGVTLVPQGHRVFGALSVLDNLLVGPRQNGTSEHRNTAVQDILREFPALHDRQNDLASHLSAGQRQMVAIMRAFLRHPKVLLLDEPTLGLAPPLAIEVMDKVHKLCQERGTTALIVEHNLTQVARVCSRFYGMNQGRVVFEGPIAALGDVDIMRIIFSGVSRG